MFVVVEKMSTYIQKSASLGEVVHDATPTISERSEPWGGLQPAYVQLLPKQLKSTFAQDGDYTRFDVSDDLRRLGARLDLSPDVFSFTFTGYKLFECLNETCSLDRVYLPMVSTGMYHPYRSSKHSSRCVARTIDVLDFIATISPADYVQFMVLTAPGWVSDQLLDPGVLGSFKKAVSFFYADLPARLFPGKTSKLGAIFGVHTWSSKHPLEKHLHAHSAMPNVAYNSDDEKFYRFNPCLDEKVVKECWRDALKEFKLWDDPDPDHLPDVGLEYASLNPFDAEARAKLVHHIKYNFRLPLADLNENLEREAVEALDLDERFARHLMGYTTRRHRVGWMTNLKRFGSCVCRKSTSQPCPICGSEMAYLGLVRSNLPDVDHFFQDRKGEWVQTPPPFDPIAGDEQLIPSPRRGAGRARGVVGHGLDAEDVRRAKMIRGVEHGA